MENQLDHVLFVNNFKEDQRIAKEFGVMIAITWTTQERIFASVEMVTEKHRLCYSRNMNDIVRAKNFLKTMDNHHENRKIHIVPDTEEAWKSLIN